MSLITESMIQPHLTSGSRSSSFLEHRSSSGTVTHIIPSQLLGRTKGKEEIGSSSNSCKGEDMKA